MCLNFNLGNCVDTHIGYLWLEMLAKGEYSFSGFHMKPRINRFKSRILAQDEEDAIMISSKES